MKDLTKDLAEYLSDMVRSDWGSPPSKPYVSIDAPKGRPFFFVSTDDGRVLQVVVVEYAEPGYVP